MYMCVHFKYMYLLFIALSALDQVVSSTSPSAPSLSTMTHTPRSTLLRVSLLLRVANQILFCCKWQLCLSTGEPTQVCHWASV